MDEETVRAIAQGRIWSGTAGRSNGLVDHVGGLWSALRIARAAAGLGMDRPVEIAEGPELGWINLQRVIPSPIPQLGSLAAQALGLPPWFRERERPHRAATAIGSAASRFRPDVPASASLGLFGPTSPLAALPAGERFYVRQALRMAGRPMVMMPPLSLDGIDLCVPPDEE